MGWKIGLPSLKLNNAGVKSKHCGSFAQVAREALEERQGRDPDIDPAKAALNRFEGYRTAEELLKYSADHVAQLRDAKGRKIRSDAVAMCVTVIKPPAAMMNRLSVEDQQRLLQDAYDAFCGIVGAERVRSRADHFDELGAHTHVFWEPITDDGRLCAKELHNLQFFKRVNTQMPELLRERGWDVDNCEMYDEAEKDYEAAKRLNGRSSARYKADAELQKAQAIAEKEKAQERAAEFERAAAEAQAKAAALERAAAERRAHIAELERIAVEAQERLDDLDRQADEIQEWMDQIPDWPAYEAEAQQAFNAIDKLREAMQTLFESRWIFRNRNAEKGLLQLVSGVRDSIMVSVSAMRGYEVSTNMEDGRCRSKAVTKSLEAVMGTALEQVRPRNRLRDDADRERFLRRASEAPTVDEAIECVISNAVSLFGGSGHLFESWLDRILRDAAEYAKFKEMLCNMMNDATPAVFRRNQKTWSDMSFGDRYKLLTFVVKEAKDDLAYRFDQSQQKSKNGR